ncbi:MAG: peptidoglycan-binding domain-containing protein [Ruthenibacterium lactatiformans]
MLCALSSNSTGLPWTVCGQADLEQDLRGAHRHHQRPAGHRTPGHPGAPLRIGSTDGRSGSAIPVPDERLRIPVIAFDGIYGTATAEAVRYQRPFGLAVDGAVGPAT